MVDLLAIVDGRLMPVAEATVPAADPGFVRGDAVFEVVRIYDGRPFALDEHLARMVRSAARMRLELDPVAVRAEIVALLAETRSFSGVIRFIVTRGGRRIGMLEQPQDSDDPVALRTIVHAPTPLLAQIKSVSYAANMLGGRLAVEEGAEDALFVSPQGHVLEGPTFTIFMRFAGETDWLTPPLGEHVLDSITRRAAFAVLGASAREQVVEAARLTELDEAFLASTVREARPVGSIDGRALPQAPGAATLEIRAALRAQIAARCAAAEGPC